MAPGTASSRSRGAPRGGRARRGDIDHARGVPAVVADGASAIEILVRGWEPRYWVPEGLRETEHSMGGEFLRVVPREGARCLCPARRSRSRLRATGSPARRNLDVDEPAAGLGVRLLAVTALKALEQLES